MRPALFSSLSTSLCLATVTLCDTDMAASQRIHHVTALLHEAALDCLNRNLTSSTDTIEVSQIYPKGVGMVSVSRHKAGGLVVYSDVHDAQGEQRFNVYSNPLYDKEPDGRPDAIAMWFNIHNTTPPRWTPLTNSQESIFNFVDAQRVYDLELNLFLQYAGCTDGE